MAKGKGKAKGEPKGKRAKKTFGNVAVPVAGPSGPSSECSNASSIVARPPNAHLRVFFADALETPTPAAHPTFGSIQLLDGTDVAGAVPFPFDLSSLSKTSLSK